MSPKLLLVLFLGCVALKASGGIITTRPDPPLLKSAFGDDLQSLDIDFNNDGQMDIRLVSEFGFMVAYFDWPTRVVVKWKLVEGSTNVDYQGMAGCPSALLLGVT
jgi:hypothetical protein